MITIHSHEFDALLALRGTSPEIDAICERIVNRIAIADDVTALDNALDAEDFDLAQIILSRIRGSLSADDAAYYDVCIDYRI